jgi:hypothetical protein
MFFFRQHAKANEKNAKQCMSGTQQKKKIMNPARTLLVEFLEKKLPYGTEMSFSQSRTEVLMP